jgi:hypothetical protein
VDRPADGRGIPMDADGPVRSVTVMASTGTGSGGG